MRRRRRGGRRCRRPTPSRRPLAAATGPLGAAGGGMPLGKPGAPAAEPFGPVAGGGAAFEVFEDEMVAGDHAGASADYEDGGCGAAAADEGWPHEGVADEVAGAALLGLAFGEAAEALGEQMM